MRSALNTAAAVTAFAAAQMNLREGEVIIPGRDGLEIIRPGAADVNRFGRKDADADAKIAQLLKDLKDTREELVTREARIKALVEKAQGEVTEAGKTSTETKAALTELAKEATSIAGRLQSIEQKLAANENRQPGNVISLGAKFGADEKVKAWLADKGGKVRFGSKSITSITTGSGAAGDLIQPLRVPGIIRPEDRPMTIRQLLSQGRTSSNAIEYVVETGFTNSAAPVAETTQKPESDISFDLRNAPVRTIAHWIQASKQVLDDVPMLESYIDTRLRYGLELVEEDQILAGDGTGQNLLGLIPQATAFDDAFSKPGDTRIDTVRRAINQVRKSEYRADAVVMHPDDWTEIELTKTNEGAYVWANPRGLLGPTLWGLPVVDTTAVEPGEFLVGAFRMAATIWDREDANVVASTEDRDNFIKNMVTIRGEERLALTVFRPEALVYGDFDTIVSS